MLDIALFIQKVLHLLKYWEKKRDVYVSNEEDTSSLYRDSEVVLALSPWPSSTGGFKAGRLAAHPSFHCTPQHCPDSQQALPSSEPWG